MAASTTLSRKLGILAVSTIVSLAVAAVAYRRWSAEPPTVRVVDTSKDLRRLLSRRERDPGPEPAGGAVGYPPPLVREPVDEKTAALFFPALTGSKEHWQYDPLSYSRRVDNSTPFFRRLAEHPDGGWQLGTNDRGMREDEDVRKEAPDLRIVVTGDSHTDGVCANAESFPNVLERLLACAQLERSVECLNAGIGGHHLYNYVGTFERLADLEPDVFVVAVYGGNDFSSAMAMHRYFNRRPPFAMGPHQLELTGQEPGLGGFSPQELYQNVYFLNNPEDLPLAIDVACTVSVELQRMCSEVGAELFLVYLPPPSRGQPERYRELLRGICPASEREWGEAGVSDLIADAWLSFLEERGIPHVDLRPSFRAAEERLYWETDQHVNVAGHALIGEILFEQLSRLLAK